MARSYHGTYPRFVPKSYDKNGVGIVPFKAPFRGCRCNRSIRESARRRRSRFLEDWRVAVSCTPSPGPGCPTAGDRFGRFFGGGSVFWAMFSAIHRFTLLHMSPAAADSIGMQSSFLQHLGRGIISTHHLGSRRNFLRTGEELSNCAHGSGGFAVSRDNSRLLQHQVPTAENLGERGNFQGRFGWASWKAALRRGQMRPAPP